VKPQPRLYHPQLSRHERDEARRQLGEERNDTGSFELLADHDLVPCINALDLKHRLRDIKSLAYMLVISFAWRSSTPGLVTEPIPMLGIGSRGHRGRRAAAGADKIHCSPLRPHLRG
jgi:hypothetical protein